MKIFENANQFQSQDLMWYDLKNDASTCPDPMRKKLFTPLPPPPNDSYAQILNSICQTFLSSFIISYISTIKSKNGAKHYK